VTFDELSTGQVLFALAFAAALSIGVFLHADKRGNKRATLWGAGVFLFAGIVLPLYVYSVWRSRRRRV